MQIADSIDFRGFSRYLKTQIREGMEDVARFFVDDITDRIPKRLSYDGGPQKANARSTVIRKGHSVPLRDKRVLEDKAQYSFYSNQRDVHVVVKPPVSRRKPVRILEARGYRFWGISAAVRKYANERLPVAWENAKRRMSF